MLGVLDSDTALTLNNSFVIRICLPTVWIRCKMDQFVRADSTNLPKIQYLMILEYMTSSDKHNIAEIRGAKALLSSRDSYVDSAVGYVEVKRNRKECVIRAKVVPEHKVSIKQYVVTITVNEDEQAIIQATCDGCAASAGGCKHTLVFLSWLDKKSNEPASTSVECYWGKPKLSGVKSNPIKCEDVFPKSKKIKLSPKDPNVLNEFLNECKNQGVKNSLATYFTNPKQTLNIFDLALEYLESEKEDYDKFMTFVESKLSIEVINKINEDTKNQANSKLWHYLRQGRITASKIYEASRCKVDGALVQQIMGGYKVPETEQIKRGKRLENLVIREIERTINKTIEKSGFLIINPVVGASPDGIGDDFIVEVKCPTTEKSSKSYVDKGIIKEKFVAQMQIQMCAAKKKRGLFCVADPKFEENKKINIYWLSYNEDLAKDLIEKSLIFWKQFIYCKIISSASS